MLGGGIGRALLAGFLIVGGSFGLAAETDKLAEDARAKFKPLPAVVAPRDDVTKARIELGRRLFFETRVSADGNVSCGHCHHAELAATDGLQKAIGVFGKVNPRNAPSVWNAGLQFKEHWRGDRESLEDQAEKSLLGPASFGNPDLATPMNVLKSIPDYGPAFKEAFPGDPDAINSKNWGAAIAAFERTLLTPSRFDAFLSGDAAALNQADREGLRKFIDIGCVACHNGTAIGGNSFEKFGIYADYWTLTGSPQPDKGRADVTKSDVDLYVFKVPPLRNVAKTSPYFHDGSVAELPKAVRIMGKTQLGVDLSDTDVAAIVTFLNTLTGPVPANYIAPEPFKDGPKP
jgi:cytochrome c peroxidase